MFKVNLYSLTVFILLALFAFSAHASAKREGTENLINSTNLKKWKSLSPEQKDIYREKFRKFKKLEAGQKKKLINKFKLFSSLSKENKEIIIENWKKFKKFPVKRKMKIRKLFMKWQNMDANERKLYRKKIEKFRKRQLLKKRQQTINRLSLDRVK